MIIIIIIRLFLYRQNRAMQQMRFVDGYVDV